MRNFKKRILVISNLYPSKSTPYYGSFVKNFCNQLGKDRRVSKLDKVVLSGLHSSKIVKIYLYIVYYLKILYKTTLTHYDLIYVHLISHSTLPLRLVNFFKKLNIVFNIHGEDLLVTTPLAKALLKQSLPLVRKARNIVVPSIYFKNITKEYLPDFPEDKIIVSASGGVKSIFSPGRDKISNEFKVGFVSRIDRGKGWDVLIEAIRVLAQKKLNIKVSIVGGGPQICEMNELIARYNLKNVEYIGPIAHDELPEYYRSLDVFIFPTVLRESLGLVGLEAMACGVPVIGSNIGGLTDYIVDGYNGFMFNPGDACDLANKIEKYYSLSLSEKEKLSENAALTSKRYSDKTVASTLFDKIL